VGCFLKLPPLKTVNPPQFFYKIEGTEARGIFYLSSWENREFPLENQMDPAVPFEKLQKIIMGFDFK